MAKRIALGILFVLFSGALIVGAANRTTAKAEKVAETAVTNPSGNGSAGERLHENAFAENGTAKAAGEQSQNGHWANTETAVDASTDAAVDATTNCVDGDCLAADGAALDHVGGNANGRGANGSHANGSGQQLQDGSQTAVPLADIVTYTGTVAQAPASGVDLILHTDSEDVTVGTGPSSLSDLGIQLAAGDELEVVGYWENGEFKANTITRLSDGLTITLRDELGRPYWSGGAQNGRGGNGRGGGRWNTQANS